MITLCVQCFPPGDTVEVYSMTPITGCAACGSTGRRYLFARDVAEKAIGEACMKALGRRGTAELVASILDPKAP
jgi:hypothetical protein